MLYADSDGNIFDHPFYRIAGFSGSSPFTIREDDLIKMPCYSKLFFIPDCPPVGLNPDTGEYETVPDIKIDGKTTRCFAVAAFLEPGFVRIHLPAVDYSSKSYCLPMWGYTAVGFKDDNYYTTAFRIEYSHRWDPNNYDDEELVPAIEKFFKGQKKGPLAKHLENCATHNHCFAAKNLFLKRWEAPLPVSQTCNAHCLGCLSLQDDDSCDSSHQRISFRPCKDEIVNLACNHLEQASEAIVSYGQGCEGEPLMEYELICDSIRDIRERTSRGTINLNTNGSVPDRVRAIAESGLDSIRISINSARPELYAAYYRPRGYDFRDVVASISIAQNMGLYTMINYLIFPGISDQPEEIEALERLIEETGIDFIHFKNLNIDPALYMEKMPLSGSRPVGMKKMANILKKRYPDLELGYFNQPINPDLKPA